MFTPRFSWPFELKYNLEEIDRLRYRVERTLIMPKHEEWLRREAFIRTAYSSTMVENQTITEEEADNAAKPYPSSDIPTERPDVANYARALTFVDFLSEMPLTNIPVFNESTIMQIHWQLMHGIHDTHIMPGKFRTAANWIEDQGIRVYEPPIHIDVPGYMREFSEWLSAEQDFSSVIKAGIAHLHLVAIHPFVDGNGRTARLLALLLLQCSNYGFRKLISLDTYYQRNRGEYIDSLRRSLGKQFHPDYDSTEWLIFFTKTIILQAGLLESRLTDWRIQLEQIHKQWASTGLSERQIDGLIYAGRMGFISRKYYAEIANVSPLTASRDLAVLVKRGFLRPEGKGRNLRYRLSSKE